MRTVVITGASKGLGLAISEKLLALDYQIIGLSRSPSPLQAVKSLTCDVSDYQQIKNIARDIKDENVVGLINAAGIASMNLAFSTPEATSRNIIEVNLLGTIFSCQLLGKLLARKKIGSIINFSTIAVKIGLKGESVYVASKAGVEGFTKSFAREMADFNVTVNAIAPGPVDTDLIRNVPLEQIENVLRHQIIPEKSTAPDIADIVSLLLSPEARKISGHVINVGGA